jgi:transcriptional regulator with XRE-family HTH domain
MANGESEIGARLRKLRERRRLSQKVLAELAARSDRWLREVEAGRLSPRLVDLEALAQALQVDVIELLEIEPVNRRDFLRAGAAAGLIGAAVPAIELDRLSRLPGQLDGRTLADLESLLETYLARRYDAGPTVLLAAVSALLRNLHELAATPRPRSIERRLQALTCRSALLAGWAAHRTDNQAAAFAYCGHALDQARAASDRHLEARTIFMTTLLYPGESGDDRNGSLGPVLAMLDAAETVAGKTPPTYLRSWIGQRRSEELAADRKISAAEREMDLSDAIGSRPDGDPEVPEWSPLYRARIANLGGQPQQALDLLHSSLDPARNNLKWLRFVALLGTAHAYANLSEPVAAATSLSEALRLAIEGGDSHRVRRILDCRGRLSRWQSTPAVRELDVQLAQVHW